MPQEAGFPRIGRASFLSFNKVITLLNVLANVSDTVVCQSSLGADLQAISIVETFNKKPLAFLHFLPI
jgi:hypothetical protein